MDCLPAIDLCDGNVVRLERGDYDLQSIYGNDPLSVAKSYEEAGATWLHVVDLNAARDGKLAHLEILKSICQETELQVEFGGGVRDSAAVETLLAAGAARLVIGSAALKNWDWFEGLVHRDEFARRLVLGLDARNGKLAVEGWREQLSVTALEVARQSKDWPLAAIVYTDIARDGMLSGINIKATQEIVQATNVPVVASGGFHTLEDIDRCRKIGCGGVILGKALYEGKVSLRDAISRCN